MDGLEKLTRNSAGLLAYYGFLLWTLIYRRTALEPNPLVAYILYVPPLVIWLLFVPFLLRVRKLKPVGPLLFALSLCSLYILEPIAFISNSKTVRDADSPLKLLTINAHGDVFGNHSTLSPLAEGIAKINPDLVCLQEVWSREQLSLLKAKLPDYNFVVSQENVDADIFPLQGCVIGFKEKEWHAQAVFTLENALSATLSKNGILLSLTNIHGSKSPGLSPRAVSETARLELSQAKAILSQTKGFAGPVIVCGDFNSPPTGPGVKLITKQMRSAFRECGNGTSWTFPSSFPLIAIDHVFGNHFVSFSSIETVDLNSDHLGLICELSLINDRESDTKPTPTPLAGRGRTHQKTR